jgi:hypothetical protein
MIAAWARSKVVPSAFGAPGAVTGGALNGSGGGGGGLYSGAFLWFLSIVRLCQSFCCRALRFGAGQRADFGGRTRFVSAAKSSSGNSRRYCSTPSWRYSIAVTINAFQLRVLHDHRPRKYPAATDFSAIQVASYLDDPPGRAADDLGGGLRVDQVVRLRFFCNRLGFTSVNGNGELAVDFLERSQRAPAGAAIQAAPRDHIPHRPRQQADLIGRETHSQTSRVHFALRRIRSIRFTRIRRIATSAVVEQQLGSPCTSADLCASAQ